jgi:hypothetical protein
MYQSTAVIAPVPALSSQGLGFCKVFFTASR